MVITTTPGWTGGTGGTGGGSGGSSGTGGTGSGDDCTRVCESPCLSSVLPGTAVDDCIRACRMDAGGFMMCLPEAVTLLGCLETVSCEPSSAACLDAVAAYTACLSG